MSDDPPKRKGYKFSAEVLARRAATSRENRRSTPRYQNILSQLRRGKSVPEIEEALKEIKVTAREIRTVATNENISPPRKRRSPTAEVVRRRAQTLQRRHEETDRYTSILTQLQLGKTVPDIVDFLKENHVTAREIRTVAKKTNITPPKKSPGLAPRPKPVTERPDHIKRRVETRLDKFKATENFRLIHSSLTRTHNIQDTANELKGRGISSGMVRRVHRLSPEIEIIYPSRPRKSGSSGQNKKTDSNRFIPQPRRWRVVVNPTEEDGRLVSETTGDEMARRHAPRMAATQKAAAPPSPAYLAFLKVFDEEGVGKKKSSRPKQRNRRGAKPDPDSGPAG
ncbi:MAG: hypothetical protein AB7H77_09705 [Bdellovibrionales bacterium]